LTLSGAVPVSLSAYARITSIRANIVGPWRSAISNNACIAACDSLGIVFRPGEFGDEERDVAECDQRFPSRQYDRIEKLPIP
jgi:hypothetical protein